ncbi:hypothetical protein [Streptomyces sp. 1-11]|uniref:hypothetical protein n=1 Tax=Streptomyces sp. 1-11 TaxID=2590549 RepID=UPI00116FB8BE|nr:hypothetical protein [Streptomyces sp. 1-11]GEK01694.1 hypothetical protein TNCT1_39700 [Streptomyces sp. 1-11]
MTHARGSMENASDWAWLLGILAAYFAVSYLLEYRARRRRGSPDAAPQALHDLGDRQRAQPPRQHLASRLVMLGGALAVAGAAIVTPEPFRMVVTVLTGLLAVGAWAFFDHRTEVRASRRTSS